MRGAEGGPLGPTSDRSNVKRYESRSPDAAESRGKADVRYSCRCRLCGRWYVYGARRDLCVECERQQRRISTAGRRPTKKGGKTD